MGWVSGGVASGLGQERCVYAMLNSNRAALPRSLAALLTCKECDFRAAPGGHRDRAEHAPGHADLSIAAAGFVQSPTQAGLQQLARLLRPWGSRVALRSQPASHQPDPPAASQLGALAVATAGCPRGQVVASGGIGGGGHAPHHRRASCSILAAALPQVRRASCSTLQGCRAWCGPTVCPTSYLPVTWVTMRPPAPACHRPCRGSSTAA